jgi:NAD+ kinase
MLSPSSNPLQKKFRRVTLVGKHQADGISEHLQELAHILIQQGCELSIESETAAHLQIKGSKTLPLTDFRDSTDWEAMEPCWGLGAKLPVAGFPYWASIWGVLAI